MMCEVGPLLCTDRNRSHDTKLMRLLIEPNMRRRRLLQAATASTVALGMGTGTSAVFGQTMRRHREHQATPFRSAGRRVKQAPFGNSVSASIVNYNRVSPYIGTAGLLKGDALAEAKQLGFRLVIDLRGRDEDGVSNEAQRAARLGIERIEIPVTGSLPGEAQVSQFRELVNETSNYPVLVHCVSANRVGALWALYRVSVGVDPEVAVQEGRAVGLDSREKAVRRALDIG